MFDSSKEVEDKYNEDKHQFWQNHVTAWERSGISLRFFKWISENRKYLINGL